MSWQLDGEHRFGPTTVARRYRFPSGLRAILLRDPAAPIVAYQTWYRVGSSHEQPGRTGMAHLFEHLMFNQTESLSPGEYDRLVEETGGNSNAATWVDWTFYQLSLPARDLKLAIRLESERMERLTLDPEQLESEREVVANERLERVEDDVDGFLDEELHRLAFTVHPYHWPTIGWMEDIRSLALPDVRAFYRTYYAPNNASIVVVGDIDEDKTLGLIEEHYGHMPAAELPADQRQAEPPQTEQRRADYEKPVTAPRILCGYRAPGQAEPDWATLDVIATILSGGPSSRLRKRLVDDLEMASHVSSGVSPFRDPSLFRIGVSTNRGHTSEQVLGELDAAVAGLVDRPVEPSELFKARAELETALWAELETVDGKAEALGHFETTFGDFSQLFTLAERIRSVTADDVQRVAATYLTENQRTLVAAVPESQS